MTSSISKITGFNCTAIVFFSFKLMVNDCVSKPKEEKVNVTFEAGKLFNSKAPFSSVVVPL